ncbi:eukaryotic translation initiation factor 5B isoform X2 [Magallana gigas]|uniref:eukaryotic translation initiation factor 5B isoform X2 n=1 Tax=Magallana gigas TaxID=29159 RepID=UPI0033422DAC
MKMNSLKKQKGKKMQTCNIKNSSTVKKTQMEKLNVKKCYLNIETLRKDRQMTWEERMDFLMPKMNIGSQKDYFEVIEDEDKENEKKTMLQEMQRKTEITPPKKTSKKNSAPVKKKDKENLPLTSTALYLTQTDLVEKTPDVSLIPKSSGAKQKKDHMLSSPFPITGSRPGQLLRQLTSTPNCSRKEQLKMDLSAIQLPVQEDELEIHSSTLVNSLEIVPLDDSIEMPPPIDTQQILQFNQKTREKKQSFVKTSKEGVKRKVANVLTKHGELFQFKSKVSEILHKAKDIGIVKEKDVDVDSRDEDLQTPDEPQCTEQSSENRKRKIMAKVPVLERNMKDNLEKRAMDISEIKSINESSHNSSSSKQRLSFKDLSIHKECELQSENKDEVDDLPSENEVLDNLQSKNKDVDGITTNQMKSKVSVGKDDYSQRLKRNQSLSSSHKVKQTEESESMKRNRGLNKSDGQFRHSSTSKEISSSHARAPLRHWDSVKKSIAEDDLCSWKHILKKRAVVKEHVYPKLIMDASNAPVDDILKNFLRVTSPCANLQFRVFKQSTSTTT